jgi:hypothetical protein
MNPDAGLRTPAMETKPGIRKPAAPPPPDPRVAAIWLRQFTLLLAFGSGAVALAVALYAGRSLLKSVFCACVAMLLSAFVGTILSRLFVEQGAAGAGAAGRNALLK